MKTEQEIEKLAQLIGHIKDDCENCDCKSCEVNGDDCGCVHYICATFLVDAGYGDVSEYKAEIEQLNEKLAKQIRIARDANAKFTGVEHYLKPFQYKADRLQTKCDELKELSDWQRKEIKRLKSEYEQLQTNAEILARGVRDFNHENYELTEKIKQTETDTINTIVKYCESPSHWNELKDCKLFGGKSDDLRDFLNGIFKEVDV